MTQPVRQMLLAVTLFALMGICVKYLSHLPAMEIVLFRCLISLTICLFMLKRIGISGWGKRENRPLLLARGTCGTFGLGLFFWTVQEIPLASAVVIQYLAPIFTAILTMVFLKEKLKGVQWLFFLISFIGTVLLKGWDERVSWFFLGVGVAAAVFSGFAYLFIRAVGNKEHPLVFVFYFQVIAVSAGVLYSFYDFTMPTLFDAAMLLGVGVFAHGAQLAMTKSIQGEKAGVVLSLVYIGAVYAALTGWLLFDEYLTWGNVLAIGLIILGVLLNIRENSKGRKESSEQRTETA